VTRIIGHADVTAILHMKECITLMRQTLAGLARGRVTMPARQHLALPHGSGTLGMMPAFLHDGPSLGIKVLTAFAGNEGTALDSHQGAVLLFDASNGRLLAVIDATAVTAIRTAAVSGVATELLSAPGSRELALLGTGTQAITHLDAMCAVRPIVRVRVWSRSRVRATELARQIRARGSVDAEAVGDAREAVEGAQIVCTTTSSREPVLEGAWLAPGTHVNAVGAAAPTRRELDSEAILRSALFVDRRESALREAGDVMIPLREGAITEAHIRAEIGELLVGLHPGRGDAAAITVFKSVGLAAEDVACARYLYDHAEAAGLGTDVSLGGARFVMPTSEGHAGIATRH
jgi:ornithine cyclodeaminase/alanine dehydrogenase-like protein (mu-crystallin family)